MKCKTQGCGSYAINHSEHGRDGSDPDLCDVCYWRTRAETAHEQLEAIGAGGVNGPLMRTPTSGAAALPEALRVPLDSLHADAGYLCGRLLNGSLTQEQVVESIRRRIDAAKLAALTAQAISKAPDHVAEVGNMVEQAISAEPAGAGYAALPDEGEPWRGHKFKEVQRGCWRCDCGKTIKEVTSDQSTPASGGNYPVMPKRYTVDDDGEELFTAEKMRAFADATHTLRASHGQAPAWATKPTEQQILEAAFAPAQPVAEASRFGSPELQAMIVARCVAKDQADSVQDEALIRQMLEALETCNDGDGYNGPYQYYETVPVEEAVAAARARLLEADLAKLTERGAVAWPGIDAQDLRDGSKP